MRTRLLTPFIAAFLLVPSGCGTIANMNGETVLSVGGPFPQPTTPFGGVARDLKLAVEPEMMVVGLPFTFFLLLDAPVSLAGDIITLPWATHRWLRPPEEKSRSKTEAALADK